EHGGNRRVLGVDDHASAGRPVAGDALDREGDALGERDGVLAAAVGGAVAELGLGERRRGGEGLEARGAARGEEPDAQGRAADHGITSTWRLRFRPSAATVTVVVPAARATRRRRPGMPSSRNETMSEPALHVASGAPMSGCVADRAETERETASPATR